MFGKKIKVQSKEELERLERVKELTEVKKEMEGRIKELEQKTNDLIACTLKVKQIQRELNTLKGAKSAKRRALWDKVDTELDIEYHPSIIHDVDDIIDALYETEKVVNEATSNWIVQKIVTSTKTMSKINKDGRVKSDNVILAGKLLAKRVQKKKVTVQLN